MSPWTNYTHVSRDPNQAAAAMVFDAEKQSIVHVEQVSLLNIVFWYSLFPFLCSALVADKKMSTKVCLFVWFLFFSLIIYQSRQDLMLTKKEDANSWPLLFVLILLSQVIGLWMQYRVRVWIFFFCIGELIWIFF